MKKFLCILMALSLVACSEQQLHQGQWSEALENLMTQINDEHQAIKKAEFVDYEDFISTPMEKVSTAPKPAQPNDDGSFSLAQVEADVNYLFDCLRNEYGLYDYFGGDEVFMEAREKVLSTCKISENLSKDFLLQILYKELDFICDMHFYLNGSPTSYTMKNMRYPYFCDDKTFMKVKDGFVDENGKTVVEVEGYKNVEEVIRLSLNEDGELVYWLVMQGYLFDENMEAVKSKNITVKYSDGTAEVLVAKPQAGSSADYGTRESLELNWIEDVPVLTVKDFTSGMMQPYAEEMKNSDVVVLNLQDNGGGYMPTVPAWYEEFCGEEVTSNNLMIYRNYLKADSSVLGYERLNDDAAVMCNSDDKFVDNDRLTIFITNKNTASAGELFIDMAFNVENTLIVGESTMGALTSGMSFFRTLPYSKLTLNYGNSVHLWPKEHFEECRGIEPDIWCPGFYAEEAVLKFIKNNVK